MSLGRKLVEIRQDRGFSQAVMATRGKLSQGYLSQLENDEIPNPSAVVLLNLARGLNLDPSILFEAAGFESQSRGRFGFMSLPVDLDLLSFCSSLSLKEQKSLLGYLSPNQGPSTKTSSLDPKGKIEIKKVAGRRSSGEKLGRVIRQMRDQRGLTQGQLSRMAEVSQGYMSQLENGEVKRPSTGVLFRIAKAFEIDVDELFEAAGYQIGRDLEDSYFALSSRVLPELLGFFAQFSAETQRRLLSHLKGIENLLATSQEQEVSAHHKVD